MRSDVNLDGLVSRTEFTATLEKAELSLTSPSSFNLDSDQVQSVISTVFSVPDDTAELFDLPVDSFAQVRARVSLTWAPSGLSRAVL